MADQQTIITSVKQLYDLEDCEKLLWNATSCKAKFDTSFFTDEFWRKYCEYSKRCGGTLLSAEIEDENSKYTSKLDRYQRRASHLGFSSVSKMMGLNVNIDSQLTDDVYNNLVQFKSLRDSWNGRELYTEPEYFAGPSVAQSGEAEETGSKPSKTTKARPKKAAPKTSGLPDAIDLGFDNAEDTNDTTQTESDNPTSDEKDICSSSNFDTQTTMINRIRRFAGNIFVVGRVLSRVVSITSILAVLEICTSNLGCIVRNNSMVGNGEYLLIMIQEYIKDTVDENGKFDPTGLEGLVSTDNDQDECIEEDIESCDKELECGNVYLCPTPNRIGKINIRKFKELSYNLSNPNPRLKSLYNFGMEDVNLLADVSKSRAKWEIITMANILGYPKDVDSYQKLKTRILNMAKRTPDRIDEVDMLAGEIANPKINADNMDGQEFNNFNRIGKPVRG